MNKRLVKTATARLFTASRVLFACFLVVGIWKVASSNRHRNNIPHENSSALPVLAVAPKPIATPSPQPPALPKDKDALLAEAVEQNDVESVKALLRKGANPNAVIEGSRDRLSEAAWNGNLKMVKLLLRYGADVNPKHGPSPLACASYADPKGLPIMRLLIRNGADVNARFDKYTTVMSIARFHSGDEAVALLKRHGARR